MGETTPMLIWGLVCWRSASAQATCGSTFALLCPLNSELAWFSMVAFLFYVSVTAMQVIAIFLLLVFDIRRSFYPMLGSLYFRP